MTTKKIFPLLLLCLAAVFTGCLDDAELEPRTATDIAEFKANDIPGPPVLECEASLPANCPTCKIRVTNLTKPNAEWSIRSYNGGGDNGSCCVNGKYVRNVDFGSGCGTEATDGNWQYLKCGMNYGFLALQFRSRDCYSSTCEYDTNTATLQINCGNGTKTFSITANQVEDGECVAALGLRAISINSDCSF